MVRVGVHVSIAKSMDTAVDNAIKDKCDTFQIFTRNPRGWKFGALDPEEVSQFKDKLAKSGLSPVVDHMPYLPNLSCPDEEMYDKSTSTFNAEVERCVELGVRYLVVHLGSHRGAGREVGLQRLSNAINEATKRAKADFQICLENTAGQQNSMGSKFEDLQEILDTVKQKDRVGVCFDTCLPAGSLVFSNDVPRRIEDMSQSDDVVSFDGSVDRVVKVWKRTYSGKIVSFKPEGLPWVRMTPEHPILCAKFDGWLGLDESPWRTRIVRPPQWIYAREMKPGYFVVMPKLKFPSEGFVDFRPYIGSAARHLSFPSIMPLTGDLAELMGLYLAEGFTFMGHGARGGDSGKIFFAFGRHEKRLIDRVRSLVDRLFSLSTWIDEKGTAVKVCVGSNVLTRFLRDSFGPSARLKRIPSFALRSSQENIKAFLRGYLCGDGCIDERGLRFTTASQTVAYQLIHLLARIDVRGTVSSHGPTEGRIEQRKIVTKGWHVVHVGSHEARKLGFDYNFPAASPRRILRDENNLYLPVREIGAEPYQGTVYNLTTENGTYAAPFIVTHNCHAYAAGYDLHVEKAVQKSLEKFDETVGFENLRVVHLNDSENGLGSGLDRHEHIGMGYIGNSGFKAVLHHKAIRDLPMILETPIDDRRGVAGNLETVRRLAK